MNSYSYLPLWTLFKKEVYRFLKVGMQTILGPAISSLLFVAVLTLALGKSVATINSIPFIDFIIPGLIMMTILQNSFANASSSIGQAKFTGTIIDVLMSPLNEIELTIGYVASSVVRGLICGIVTYLGIIIFIEIQFHSFIFLIFYSLMGSIMMSSLSTMVGIWADKWDQQQGIDNFVVLPLTFLSGTFYSISNLPDFWKNISAFNPFFYVIDGFRYSFIGISDSSIFVGSVFLFILNLLLVLLVYLMFKSGYKLKS
ncbi:MAG: Inner membrane transport permease YadH [Alphaproteobacteria bacterium MarineAlpha5_Bin9]|nr:MAG: Inner membrane transport permease YadH [Alphaproteobacteria bacterium MarineAlpha5_Bin9]|tara:strand:- start:5261 stop:6031 length:771 start_codon:yes stop_codon:yes gene_type:complete